MRWFRFVRDFALILFVVFWFVTMFSKTYDYWWIALCVSIALMFPDFVELVRKSKDSE